MGTLLRGTGVRFSPLRVLLLHNNRHNLILVAVLGLLFLGSPQPDGRPG